VPSRLSRLPTSDSRRPGEGASSRIRWLDPETIDGDGRVVSGVPVEPALVAAGGAAVDSGVSSGVGVAVGSGVGVATGCGVAVGGPAGPGVGSAGLGGCGARVVGRGVGPGRMVGVGCTIACGVGSGVGLGVGFGVATAALSLNSTQYFTTPSVPLNAPTPMESQLGLRMFSRCDGEFMNMSWTIGVD
jgi:hypothetical protein